jgi:hypothetical protein
MVFKERMECIINIVMKKEEEGNKEWHKKK